METLREMFPDAAPDALAAVLEMSNGDVTAATNFLFFLQFSQLSLQPIGIVCVSFQLVFDFFNRCFSGFLS